MFYDYSHRIAFVHIPRSGGVAISLAFLPYLSVGSGWDLADMRHLPYSNMVTLLGAGAGAVRWFSVYRPLAEIRESFERFLHRERQAVLEAVDGCDGVSPNWSTGIQKHHTAREIWEQNGWPWDNENEWLKFWIGEMEDWDGKKANMKLLKFHNLKEDLEILKQEWHLPDMQLPASTVN